MKKLPGRDILLPILILNFLCAVIFKHSLFFFFLTSTLDVALSAVCLVTFWLHWFGVGRTIEWIRLNADVFIAALLCIVAWSIRRIGLYFGLPYCYGVDEQHILNPLSWILTSGNYNPHFFDYPSFGYYATLPLMIAGFLRDATAGLFLAIQDVPLSALHNGARSAAAIFSALTIPATYLLGRKIFGRPAAFAAALFLSVSHLSSETARSASFHGLATLMALIVLGWIAWILDSPSLWKIAVAGGLAGLACSTMYYCLTLLILLCATIWIWMPKEAVLHSRWQMSVIVIVAACVSFLMTTPYALLDFPTFLRSLGELSYFGGSRVWGIGGQQPGATAVNYALGYLSAFGFATAGLFLLGCFNSLLDWDHKRLLLLGFFIIHFAFLGFYHGVFTRYLSPLEPIFFLFTAGGIFYLLNLLKNKVGRYTRSFAGTALCIMVLIHPIRRQIEWFTHSREPLGCAEAFSWIRNNVADTSVILREERTPFLPARFTHEIVVPNIIGFPIERCRADGVRYILISQSIYTMNAENTPAYGQYLRALNAKQIGRYEGNDNIQNPTILIYEIVDNP